jgi:hypothetical protein
MIGYTTKILATFEYSPGGWKGLKVGIFLVGPDGEEQIGEYTRNYGVFYKTFFPFKKDDKDYALYSPHYTATRVMELPSCKDIGGEEPHTAGFCPVDFFVPSYILREYKSPDGSIEVSPSNEPDEETMRDSTHYRVISPRLYYPFGFVAGCVWGDDSSWKIQYLDLSAVDKGEIRRDARFGYIEMPNGISLKQAIDLIDYGYDDSEPYSHTALIAIRKRFDLRDGQIVE